jgi:hypothetical protein
MGEDDCATRTGHAIMRAPDSCSYLASYTESLMRHLAALAALMMLAACTSQMEGLPNWVTGFPGEQPSFGVVTLPEAPTQPGYAGFSKISPTAVADHADQICTLGWQKLGEETLPGEEVPFVEATVRCNAYRPSL